MSLGLAEEAGPPSRGFSGLIAMGLGCDWGVESSDCKLRTVRLIAGAAGPVRKTLVGVFG